MQIFCEGPYLDSPSHRYRLDSGVSAIAGAGGPACFDLGANGGLYAMYLDSPSHYYLLDTGVQAIAAAGNSLYVQYLDGELWRFSTATSTWQQLDTDVQAFVLGPGGFTVDVLKTSGDLYQHQASDWAVATLLDQNVQSIWLTDGGYTLVAQHYDGTIAYFVA